MCRIAGIIGRSTELESRVQEMTSSMAHGGPDDSGVYIDEVKGVALGHRRLSIIELSQLGHQPMHFEERGLVISFNGEIYNYEALRHELVQMGYSFVSHSDTEVLLKGYAAWGVALLPRLKGMFAFLLLDKQQQKLIAARDHAGIKPLYYGQRDGSMYFSSEVRGIQAAVPDWPADEYWPVRFLAYGFIPEPYSTLQDVQHLPKGSYLAYDLVTGQHTIHSYIQFPFSNTIHTTKEAIRQTRQTLLDAVERHLVADVPVGIFLSGGIDSSILTFACRKFNKGRIKTLSIYFEDEQYSEKYYQDLVIKKTGVDHQSFLVSQQDFENALPDIFQAMDQPSFDGINTYFITKYARQYGLKVVLSGLGADELFGGYPMFNNRRYSQLSKMRGLAKMAGAFMQKYPARKLQFLQDGDALEEYFFSRGIFVPKDIARLLGMDEQEVRQILGQADQSTWMAATGGNRVSLLEQQVYMQNQLLRDSDIYSMWHSIELRVPFLDVDLIRLAHSIDPAIKFNPQQKKHLLIEAFKEELPEAIWNRKKMGFTFPFQNWFRQSAYLQQAERELPQLQLARQHFDSGKMNWTRYWVQVVAGRKSHRAIANSK